MNRTQRSRKKTSDAVELLARLIRNKPARRRGVEKAKLNARIAEMIHQERTKAGLSQVQLAELVGTTQSVISRLEDADYDGHSLAMLGRIAEALHKRVEVRLVSALA